MAELTKLAADLDIISLLDDEPNDVGGLSAEVFKAEFDKGTNIIKDYINETLLPELAGESGAENVGITTIPGVTGAENVQAALEKIESQLVDMTQGAVADGSINSAKLADDAVTAAKIADDAVTAAKLANGAVETAALADNAVTHANMAANSVGTAQIIDRSVTHAKIANAAVGTEQIDESAITQSKLAAVSVTTPKIAVGAVTREKQAMDTMYSPIKIIRNEYTIIPGDCGMTLYPGYAATESHVSIALNDELSSAVPVGFEVAVFRGFRWPDITITAGPNLRFLVPGTVYSDSTRVHKITIPVFGEMIALKKIDNNTTAGNVWLLVGNADVEVVTS